MPIWSHTRRNILHRVSKSFSTSLRRQEIRDFAQLPPRLAPTLKEKANHDLLSLRWPSPPRNILLVRKDNDDDALEAVLEFGHHISTSYPDISLILEPHVAKELHSNFSFPIYAPPDEDHAAYEEKVDLTITFGGDGTILHAASLFATSPTVPPILSFSMGTLGFLGEWRVGEYKRAFRQAYVSGAPSPLYPQSTDEPTKPNSLRPGALQAWSNIKGKSMGNTRSSRVLMRNRLQIGLFDGAGQRLPHEPPFAHRDSQGGDIFALNEVLLHRGALPHLAHITILIGSPPHQRTLTTAISDGFLISTPTGSTAYSLSSGGSIVHPLVNSLLLTPICPRSLSFRPLVLPANTPVTLRIDGENRGKEVEVSVDGVRRQHGLKAGMEVRVVGEEVRTPGVPGSRDGAGGVPSIVRSGGAADNEDHWVGGLNSLLKFNYPFGND